MDYKTFDKLPMETKIKILLKLNLIYDLTTEKGNKAIKKEFKYIKEDIKKIMEEMEETKNKE